MENKGKLILNVTLTMKKHKIAQIFSKLKYIMTYKTNNTIRKHLNLNNNSHKISEYNRTAPFYEI